MFNEHISDPSLQVIRTKDWYRHGIFRDSVLSVSSHLPYLDMARFVREGLDVDVPDVIRIDGQNYVTDTELKGVSEKMYAALVADADFLGRYIRDYDADNATLIDLSRSIEGQDVAALSDRLLGGLFMSFFEANNDLGHWLWSLEFLNVAVDRRARELLKKQHTEWTDEQIADQLQAISYVPHKLPFQSELEDILALSFEDIKDVDNQMTNDLHQKYSWLNMYMWTGHPWTLEEYVQRIQDILRNRQKLEEELEVKDKKIAYAKSIVEDIHDLATKTFFKNLQYLIYLKTYRIDVFTESWYYVQNLIAEIGKRLGLSYDDLGRLTGSEIPRVLNGESISPGELRKRDHVVVARVDNVTNYYYGEAFHKILTVLDSFGMSDTKELKGTIGYKGIVRGIAKVLLTDQELGKLNKGDILVSNLTNPNYNPAFAIVAGLVTDEGGVLCHSAIMAREFSIPCVIGTKFATKVIQDGDMIEVDANKGTVRILEKGI